MLFRSLYTYLVVLAGVAANAIPPRDYQYKNYFIFEIDTSSSSKKLHDFIEENKGVYTFEHQARGFDDHFVFSINKSHPFNKFLGNHNSDDDGTLMKRSPDFGVHYDYLVENVRSVHQLKPKHLSKRMPVPLEFTERTIDIVDSSQQPVKDISEKLDINDPTFIEQWHLLNTLNPGNDVNVTGLWLDGITGTGVISAIIDDGLDCDSEDLADNFNAKGSWDFNDNTNLPKPRLFDDYHGTRCAGEISAVKNGVCGVGVSYTSQISGIRILSGAITNEEEAAAMMYGLDVNDIYSCSWGPTDDGRTLAAPSLLVKKAMLKAVQEGRDKKGSVYVFASGNGGRSSDSCNFDGYTNSIYSITVGSIDFKGLHPTYSEACAAVMVVTYSSGSGEHIHTTDIKGKCSSTHGGTSAAAPLAAGIYSLVLSVNKNLTWRDVQYVSALSAVPVNENDGNYQVNALGRKYSHRYGYGKIDAYQMVEFAKTWKNVNPQTWYYSDVIEVNESINRNDQEKIIKSTFKMTKEDLEYASMSRVEHVTVTVNIQSSYRGRVGARLISPFGIVSDLATFRPFDSSGSGFVNWTFMSVACWGEKGEGDWTIEVFAEKSILTTDITFKNWQLKVFGESSDAKFADVYDITKDYAAERRQKQKVPETPKTSVLVTSSSIPLPPATSVEPHTSDIRPAPIKVSSTEVEVAASTTKTTSSASPSKTTTTGTQSEHPSETSSQAEVSTTDGSSKNKHYTSDHTGLYFMGLAVVGFVVVMLLMRFHKTPGSSGRRRREEYEFDIIPGEDYTDSEAQDDDDDDDDESDNDSLDLGHDNSRRNKNGFKGLRNDQPRNSDEARDRLFDEFNAETLPDYEDDMFIIDDEDERQSKSKKYKDRVEVKTQEQGSTLDRGNEEQTSQAEPAENVEEPENEVRS